MSLLRTFLKTLVSYIIWTKHSFHVSFKDKWIQEFLSGRSRPGGEKRAWTSLFCPQLILQFQRGSNGFIAEKTILSQGTRGGSNIFLGVGSNLFQWGCANANFYRNQHNLWISRGGGGRNPLSTSGSAHDKLSVYKCTNSVRSTIKLKTVIHEIVNVKIKVWKSHSDLDVRFAFDLYREE